MSPMSENPHENYVHSEKKCTCSYVISGGPVNTRSSNIFVLTIEFNHENGKTSCLQQTLTFFNLH